MPEANYEIFISYRREGGEALAHLLYERLTNNGYKVFLDVETLRSGKFNEALYRKIEQCNDFLLLLPPNGLDRCTSENDWVRLEIEHAFRCNKNIIPLMMRNFQFPQHLPDTLRELPHYNGIKADMELFDGVIIRLEKMMCSKKHTQTLQENNEKLAKLHRIAKSFIPRTKSVEKFTEEDNVDVILYETVNKIITEEIEETDFEIVDYKIYLKQQGVDILETFFGIEDLSSKVSRDIYNAVVRIMYARYCMERDKDYYYDNAIDFYIGHCSKNKRASPRIRHADGLFQALQLKEDFSVTIFKIDEMNRMSNSKNPKAIGNLNGANLYSSAAPATITEDEVRMEKAYTELIEKNDTTGYYLYRAGVFFLRKRKTEQLAKQCLHRASDMGNKDAKWKLVRYHERRDEFQNMIDILNELASEGEGMAYASLGSIYFYGVYVPRDLNLAYKNYVKAAELGTIIACTDLAQFFKNGYLFEKDIDQAIKWYKKAITLGIKSGESEYCLGEIYKNEYKDIRESVFWYKKAARKGHIEANFILGKTYEEGMDIQQDYGESLKWYNNLLDLGISHRYQEVLKRVICFYENGLGTEQDLKKAEELSYKLYQEYSFLKDYCRKAAEYGNVHAMCEIAKCYWHGNGIEKDEEESLRWYKKAEEKGSTEAQNAIGLFYYNGIVVGKDETIACDWWQKAANSDHAEAQYNLGLCYWNGIGVARNLNQAFIWIQRAGENGEEKANYLMATWYEKGDVIEKDIDKALHLYCLAADKGHKEAKEFLESYRNHLDDEKTTAEISYQQKAYDLLKAATNGDTEAQYQLGICLEKGATINHIGAQEERGDGCALQWYIKAAENGHLEALYKVAEFYREGRGTLKDLSESNRWTQRAKARRLINEMKSAKIRCQEKQKNLEQAEQNLDQNSQNISQKMEKLHQQENEWAAEYKSKDHMKQEDFVYIKLFEMADALAMQMQENEHYQIQVSDLQTKRRQIYLNIPGVEKCEDYFGLKDLTLEIEIHQYLIACLYARYFLKKGFDYECEDNKIFALPTGKATYGKNINIVRNYTPRKTDIYFAYCIHHALELKEGLEIDNYEVLGWLIRQISHTQGFIEPISDRLDMVNASPYEKKYQFSKKIPKILKKYTLNSDESALAYYSNGALETHAKNNILITNQRILSRHSFLGRKTNYNTVYLNDIQHIGYTTLNESGGWLSFTLTNGQEINNIPFMGNKKSAELLGKIIFLIRDCANQYML